MSEGSHFEFIVIGAGVVGSATAYHLCKSGASSVLLLEQVSALVTRYNFYNLQENLPYMIMSPHMVTLPCLARE